MGSCQTPSVVRPARLGLVQPVHGEDLDLPHLGHTEAKGPAQLLGRLAALGIVQPCMRACFHTIEHKGSPCVAPLRVRA